jgi:V-type H+-transporting ATPase subunit G
MASNPHIAMLLEAEREAAAIVTRARQYRVERLKNAKSEAMAEIQALREQKQREFEEYEQSFRETTARMDKDQEEKTQKQIKHVRETVEGHKEELIQMILKKALEMNPDVN